ncbi:helix-turn-helix domain-containing protein [Streptomyces sp. NPDC000351]|uniref:helix-turn-helix domain-containing protein n=1 Tax=Streptomyces sp. NPDC000351 TaxID=3154250 RepID=UPI00332DC2DC
MADEFGPLLRELREKAGLSQQRLAEYSDVTSTHISRIERGRASNVRMDTVTRLLDAIDPGDGDRRRVAAVLARARGEVPEGPAADACEPESRRHLAPPVTGPLLEAAAALVAETRRRWHREEEQRQVHDPYPLPVRWRAARAEISDYHGNVMGLRSGTTEQPLDLDGDLLSVGTVYRRIASGRLLVLGRAGSGKSVLAIRLVLDLLEDHARTGPARLPVPVILGVGSWDPTASTLRDWLVTRLLEDYPNLARGTAHGVTLAAALVDADHVLPVLDGFDEIAADLRQEALRELNRISLPLVLTSRTEEYEAAVAGARNPLLGAAGVELTDITPEDLAAYLPRAVRRPAGDVGQWEAVVKNLDRPATDADARLRRVLSTPLMVFLARTVYGEGWHDPAELLDGARFPTEESLQQHLLAGFVPTVYRPRASERRDRGDRRPEWTPERVRRWLGNIAHHMGRADGERQDIAWWQIGHQPRTPVRVLVVGVVSALCVTVPVWLMLLAAWSLPLVELVTYRAAVGLGSGCTIGALYAGTIAFGGGVLAPTRTRLRLRLRGGFRAGRSLPRAFATRFTTLLLAGFALGSGLSCAITLHRVLYYGGSLTSPELLRVMAADALLYGLIFGLAGGTVFGLLAMFEVPLDVSSAATPDGLLKANRTSVRRQALVVVPALGVAIALGGKLITVLFEDALGPLLWGPGAALSIGIIGGLGGGLSYTLCFTAWGHWLVFACVLLPLQGRLPWNTAAFLKDAYRRGVLRRTGATYQFRHVHLQRHLGDACRQEANDESA